MKVIFQYEGYREICRINNLKTISLKSGLFEMVDNNGVVRGYVNSDKCIIFIVESEAVET